MNVKVVLSTSLVACALFVAGVIVTGSADTIYTVDTNRRASTVNAEWSLDKVTSIRAVR